MAGQTPASFDGGESTKPRARRYFGIACGVLLALAIATPSPVSATPASPGTEVAPYMDMVGFHPDQLTTALSHNLSDFTAGFVLGRNTVGHGCEPVWDDEDTSATDTSDTNSINNAIDNAVDKHGGRVTPIISFGGQGGFDLAMTCTTVAGLKGAYQSVIDRFGVKRVDFDVEGTALDDSLSHASLIRRFSAIASLRSSNPALKISFTLPSDYYGLADDGINFLNKAKTAGVRPDLVNIMAMEFSTPPPNSPAAASQGAATINAAQQTLTQIQQVWPTGPAMNYQNVSITPMIGRNINGNVFTAVDTKKVVDFALPNKIGRLAFWSLNRDRQCSPASEDLSACSKVSQNQLDFTNAFLLVRTATK